MMKSFLLSPSVALHVGGFFAFCLLFFVSVQTASKVYATGFSFTIDGVLNKVTEKNQEVSIPIVISELPDGNSYFRAAFQKESGSYFGYVKNNNGDWGEIDTLTEDCKNNKYYSVSSPDSKTITLSLKIGEDNNPENGDYFVVVHPLKSDCRYDSSDRVFTSIAIDLPIIAPTPTPSPSPTPSPTLTPTQTPGPSNTPTITSTPIPTSIDYNNIYINEFIPDPESGNEKVEIKNGNSTTVSLTNWKIDDIEGGGHDPLPFSATISSSGLHIIDLQSTGFLNNDNDSVRLLNFSNQQKDIMSYDSSTNGKSWARDRNGNWCLQDSSFGSDNSDCPVSPTNTPTATPTPTKTLTPTPTSRLTPTSLITPSLKPETTPSVLATTIDDPPLSPTVLGTTTETSSNKKIPIVAFAIIGGGVVFLSLGAFSFLKGKKKITN